MTTVLQLTDKKRPTKVVTPAVVADVKQKHIEGFNKFMNLERQIRQLQREQDDIKANFVTVFVRGESWTDLEFQVDPETANKYLDKGITFRPFCI